MKIRFWRLISCYGFLRGLLPILLCGAALGLKADGSVVIGAIGDYGVSAPDYFWPPGPSNELAVANLVKAMRPDFIITLGDNNYEYGGAADIDINIGQYFHDYIYPYLGTNGSGATSNRFFPCLGNHEYSTLNATPYLDYFPGLPGNQRYYKYRAGPVEIFAINSNPQEPDGMTNGSVQFIWLQSALAASTAAWKLVYFHHPPFSSGIYAPGIPEMRWPFAEWGASAVLSGHDHHYERILTNNLVYFINGAGGAELYPFNTVLPGSQIRYGADHGAMRIEATDTNLMFYFITPSNLLVDSFGLGSPPAYPVVLNHPRDATVVASRDTNFFVLATGPQTDELTYQWRFNGEDIAGATNSALKLTNIQPEEAGSYDVRVQNSGGAVLSQPALLTVLKVPPSIVLQPIDVVTHPGLTVQLAVQADGSQPLSYQWRLEGANLDAATNSILILSNAAISQSGRYSALVSNAYGSVLSSNAAVGVLPVYVWGNFPGGNSNLPVSLTNVERVACGPGVSVAWTGDGNVVAWGHATSNFPSGIAFDAVAFGQRHTVGLKSDGTLLAWGDNSRGQTNPPPGLSNVVAIACASDHSLALTEDGLVHGWGASESGNPPVDLSNVVSIACATSQNAALKSDGTVTMWGNIGPVTVPDNVTQIVAIACATLFTAALKSDGTVVAWGNNVKVPADLTDVVAIDCGAAFGVALKRNGSVVAWGSNVFGQTNVPTFFGKVFGLHTSFNNAIAVATAQWPVTDGSVFTPTSSNGVFSVSVASHRGWRYLLESRDATDGASFFTWPPVPGNGKVLTLSDPSAIFSGRLYRVRQQN